MAKIEDAAGNVGTESNEFMLTVDTQAPTDNNSISIDTYTDDVDPLQDDFGSGTDTNDTTPTLNGTVSGLAADDTVGIYDTEGNRLGDAVLNADRTGFTYTSAALADGPHTFVAKIEDAAGNVGTESNEFMLTVDTQAPTDNNSISIDTYTDDVDPLQDDFGSGTDTNDTTPTLNGTVSGLAADDTVGIYDTDGKRLGDAILNADRTGFTYTSAALADGPHTFVAKIEDAAGNVGTESNEFMLTVDTQAPTENNSISIDTYTDDVDPLQGDFGSGTDTNDTTPTLNGTVSGLAADDTVGIYDTDGNRLGDAILNADRTGFTYTSAALADGPHTFVAKIEDAAGNVGTESNEFMLTVDTQAPTDNNSISIDTYTDDVDPLQDDFGSGTDTNDTTPTLNGTVSGLATDDTVGIYDTDGKRLGDAILNADRTGFTYTSAALADGPHTFVAKIEDAAGNVGTESNEFMLTVDTQAPTDNNSISIDTYTDDVDPLQGDFTSGTDTNDTTPTLNGTVSGLAADDTVGIYDTDGKRLGDAILNADRTGFTYTSAALADGPHTFVAKIEDAAGNVGTESNEFMLTVDTQAPTDNNSISIDTYTDDVDPLQDDFGSGTDTNDTTPTLNGTVSGLAADDTVGIYDTDGKRLGDAILNADRTGFTYTSAALADGPHTFVAKIEDAAGNVGTESNEFMLTVDTQAPTENNSISIDTYTDDVDPLQGDFTSGTDTNDTTPTLNGTVSGLAADDTVGIYDTEGNRLGDAVLNADRTGFTYTSAALADGPHTFVAKIEDAAGNVGTESNEFMLTVDTQAPTENNSISIDTYTDDVDPLQDDFGSGTDTNDTTPTLNGTVSGLAADDTVGIYDTDGNRLGDAILNADRTGFTYTSAALADGPHTFVAKIEDAAGNVGTESNEFMLTVDTQAPTDNNSISIDTYTDDVDPLQDDFGSGTDTNDTTPTLNGTVSGLAADDTVGIYDTEGNRLGDAVLNADRTGFTYTSAALADGPHTFVAKIEDAAGNVGTESNEFMLTVDTQAPTDNNSISIDTYTDDVDPLQDDFGSGTDTNDTTPTLNGTVSGLAADDTVGIYDTDGKRLGDAILNADRTGFTYTSAALADGPHTFVAKIEDAAGNVGTESNEFMLTVDTQAPTENNSISIDTYTDDVDPLQGDFGSGTDTNDTTPTLNGTVSGLAADDTVGIYDTDGNRLGDAILNADRTGFTYTSAALADGPHTFVAKIEDAAGNVGTESNEFMLTVDTQAPTDNNSISIDTYTDDVDPLQGDFGSGTDTNDTTPTLNGTVSGLAADDTVGIYDTDGNRLGDAILNADRTGFTYTSAALADGPHTFVAKIEDAAGNVGTESNEFMLTVDTQAPTDNNSISIDTYTDDVDPLQDDFGSGTDTNDTTPTLNGTVSGLATDDTVGIYDTDGKRLGDAILNADRTGFTYTSAALADGPHTFVAKIEDAAGNVGTESNEFMLTVDTQAPTDNNSISIDTYTDDVDPLQGDFTSGTDTNDTTPTLNGTVSGLAADDTVGIYDTDGKRLGDAILNADRTGFTYTSAALADGPHTFVAKIEDAAGNVGTESNEFMLTVDTQAPTENNSISIDTYTDDVDPLQGDFTSGTDTNDTTPTLNGTVSGLAADDTVGIYDTEGNRLGDAVLNADRTGFTYTSAALADGPHTFVAKIEDAAGNVGTESNEFMLTVDTQAPTENNSISIDTYTDDVDPLQDDFGSGTDTNDTTPTLNGTVSGLAADDTVGIYDTDGNRLGDAILNADRTGFTYTSAALADGPHTFVAKIEDAAGNVGTESNEFMLTVDTQAPTENNSISIDTYTDDVDPLQDDFGSGTDTNDTTPTLNGTVSGLAADDTVGIYDTEGNRLGDAILNADRTGFTYTSAALADGPHTFVAKIEDAAGNVGTESNEFMLTVDTQAPTDNNSISIDTYTDDVDPLQDDFGSGTDTNDTTPTLNGTVSGLAADDTVGIYDTDGKRLGDAILNADRTGFTYTSAALADGPHTFVAKIEDAAGNVGTESNEFMLTVDTQAPTENNSISIDTYTDDVDPLQGDFGSGTDTNDTTPTLNGTVSGLAADDTVGIYDTDGNRLGDAVLNADRTGFTYTSAALADGPHTFVAKIEDAAGNVGTESNEFMLTVDTQAPTENNSISIDTYTDDVDPLQGDFTSGTDTNDTTPTLNGTVSGLAADDTVGIYDTDGNRLGDAILNADRTGFTYTSAALADGPHTFVAKIEDAAGNVGTESNEFMLTVDTQAPTDNNSISIDTYTDDVDPLQGDFGSGTDTNDTTPTLNGTVSGLAADDTVGIYDTEGNRLGDAVLNADRTGFTYTSAALADGPHTFVAKIEDAAGNVGTESNEFMLTVDTQAPTDNNSISIDTYTDDVDPLQDDFGSGTDTNDTTPTLNGTVSGLAADDTVGIYDTDGNRLGDAVLNADRTGFTYTSAALADGPHTFVAKIEDAAGNVGTESNEFMLTVDTQAPTENNSISIDTYTDDVDPLQGDFGSGTDTNDTTPTLNGTVSGLAADDTVGIYDTDGNRLGDAILNADRTGFTYTSAALADGPHTFVAKIEDAAGNVGTESNEFMLTVDTQAPTDNNSISIDTYTDDVDPLQDDFGSGTDTNDTTPTLNGTVSGLAADDTVGIYDTDGKRLGDAILNADRTGFTYTSAALADGPHTFVAKIEDAAGNVGTESNEFMLTVDTQAPTDNNSISIDTYTDDVDPLQDDFGSGTDTNDTTPTLNGTVSGLAADDTVGIYDTEGNRLGDAVLNADRTGFTYTSAALADGPHTFVAKIEDAAGNVGTESNEFMLTVDTQAPTDNNSISIDTYTDDVDPLQDDFGSGTDTNDTTPTLNGTVSGLAADDTVGIYDTDGNRLGDAILNADRTGFTYTSAALADGPHTFVAKIEDAAGNVGTESNEFMLTVDTQAPTDNNSISIDTYTDDVDPLQDDFGSGTDTNDTTPTLNGTVSGLAADDTVGIYDTDGNRLGDAVLNADRTGFTYTSAALADGPHTFVAKIEDAAGNVGTESNEFMLTVDTQAPTDNNSISIDTYTDDVDPLQDDFGSGTDTNDTTPTLNGTVSGLAADDTVGIYDTEGNRLGDAVLNADRTGFTYTSAALADGPHTFVAKIEDAAGNVGTESNEFMLTVDTQAPTDNNSISIDTYTDDVDPLQGDFGSGTDTNDTTPTLNGTVSGLAADDTVGIYDTEGNRLGDAVLNADRTGFTYTSAALADGPHTFVAKIEDAAGNVGTESNEFMLTVDTQAPTDNNSISIDTYTDDVDPLQDDFGSGTDTNDTTPTLNGTVSGLAADDTVGIYDTDGNRLGDAVLNADRTGFTYTSAALADGPHTFVAKIEDAAGNVGTESNEFMLTVDTQAPTDNNSISIDTYTDDVDPLQDDFGSGTDTNDTTPTLNGTVSGLAADDTVGIYDTEGNRLGDAVLNADRTGFTYTSAALADGPHTFVAKIEDAAGNVGTESNEFMLTVDTQAPTDNNSISIDTYTDDVDPLQGDFGSGTDTNDTTPTLNGTVSGLAADDTV
uniref:Bacterial Ig-like domain-containing protein n=1 Tax=Psychrobacter sp. (strain PRwf-1) TaxID=349106 RepID=A5WE85_PSYWF